MLLVMPVSCMGPVLGVGLVPVSRAGRVLFDGLARRAGSGRPLGYRLCGIGWPGRSDTLLTRGGS
jgi:hypothetical protein